jgi:hypothetical protein
VEACNGECQYDFIAFDFESDDVEALIPLIDVSPILVIEGISYSQLTVSGYTTSTKDPFGSKG